MAVEHTIWARKNITLNTTIIGVFYFTTLYFPVSKALSVVCIGVVRHTPHSFLL